MKPLCIVAMLAATGSAAQDAISTLVEGDPIFLAARSPLEIAPDAEGRIGMGEVLARFVEVGEWTLSMEGGTRVPAWRSCSGPPTRPPPLGPGLKSLPTPGSKSARSRRWARASPPSMSTRSRNVSLDSRRPASP